MNKKLETAINKFLDKKIKSNGGWAPVSDTEYNQLYEIINQLITSKYQTDPDGDYPIEFTLVNRTTHERLHYLPIRYNNKASEEEIYYLRRDLRLNLNLAFSAFDRFEGFQEYLQSKKI